MKEKEGFDLEADSINKVRSISEKLESGELNFNTMTNIDLINLYFDIIGDSVSKKKRIEIKVSLLKKKKSEIIEILNKGISLVLMQ